MEMVRETKPKSPIHPNIRKVWRLGAWLSAPVTALIFSIPAFFIVRALHDLPRFSNLSPVLVAVAAFLFGFFIAGGVTLIFADRQYASWSYELRPYDLVIRKGLMWRSERYIARDRVQHIDVNAGPFDRKFGLVQLVVYAAGGAGSVGLIPGLTPSDAEWLKEQLLATRAQED